MNSGSKPKVYFLQNKAIHKARAQLEEMGVLNPWSGLDEIRQIAAGINNGVASISALSLDQRRELIDKLIARGAQVSNPVIFHGQESNQKRSFGGKVARFNRATDEQIRMLDALAAQVSWRTEDGYLFFKRKILKCDNPVNNRQVTKLRLALTSLISQQVQPAVTNQSTTV